MLAASTKGKKNRILICNAQIKENTTRGLVKTTVIQALINFFKAFCLRKKNGALDIAPECLLIMRVEKL